MNEQWLLYQVMDAVHYALKDQKRILQCDVPYKCDSILGDLNDILISYLPHYFNNTIFYVPVVNVKVVKLDIKRELDKPSIELFKQVVQQSINGYIVINNQKYPYAPVLPFYSKMQNRYFPYITITGCFDCGSYIGFQATVVNNEYIADYLTRPKTQVVLDYHQNNIEEIDDFGVDIIFDKSFYEIGIEKIIRWDYTKDNHAFIFGPTGSQKTGMLLILLDAVSQIPDSKIIVCDFKNGGDFQFLKGCESFYTDVDCICGLEELTQIFEKRKKIMSELDRNDKVEWSFVLFVFDEWSSFLDSLDKKTAEEQKRIMANHLRLVRSFNIHIGISQQRGDSTYFQTSRDNLNLIIGVGRLSKESVSMFFQDYKDEIKTNNPAGTGYMLDHRGFRSVKVPHIKDFTPLKNNILKAVTR